MSRSYFCPNCGAALEEGVKFCANCGQSTTAQPQPPPQQQYSPQPVQQSGPYAPAQPMHQQVVHVHTGIPVPGGPSQYNRTTVLLLMLFLGWIGVHQFYVGKAGTGIAYIFLWFFFVTPILLIIDFIMILSGSFKDDRGLLVVNW